MKVNKSSGLKDIHTRFLKTGADVLAAPLTYIFNLSLHTAIIPRPWKSATVTPLHKDGSVSDPNNFRPISVLPVVMKIFERAVHSQIYQHLSTNKLLSSHQSGFRPGHSTMTCLLDVSDFILGNMDHGSLTCGVFLDLSKAFDLIDHSILKSKLAHVGIIDHALHWFDNYLTGRTQSVCVNGASSEPMDLNSGVPQGSVLRPLLFLIFINDLPNCVKQSKVVLYADDTALFFANKDVMTIERVLQEELNFLNNWFHKNGLIVNCSKTNFMVFGTSQRLVKTSRPVLMLSDSFLPVKEFSKYLGVIFDSNLNWHGHIDTIASKVSRRLGLLSRIRKYISIDVCKHLHNSIVQPLYEYCNIVWSNSDKTF